MGTQQMEHKMIIETELTKKLKSELEKCSQLIKESINKKTPIIIRHHSDADGYSAGIALERAIQPLIYEAHTREREGFYHYKRSPLLAPMYDNESANKDIANFTSEKGNQKAPLMIILDTGCGEENHTGLKKVHMYGAKIIIIDHHFPHKHAKTHGDLVVNPHFFGSEYDMSAGMIASELAHIINPKTKGLSIIASISAMGDKVESEESELYYALAKKEGYEKSDIKKIAQVIDFESYSLGFVESKQMTDDLFGANKERQEELIKIVYPFIEKKKKEALETGLKFTKIEKKGTKTIAIIPLNDITLRGEYPQPGRISGIIHDNLKDLHSPLVTIGALNDSFVLRASKNSDFDANKVIAALNEKFPEAMIIGGGHKKAAGLRFIPIMKDSLLEEIKRLI